MSFTLTKEQIHIIDAIRNGFNVKINAVAGSGKTTTCFEIAKANPNKKVLIVTYSKRLKEDARLKIKERKITNVESHSIHSFCYRYWKLKECSTDYGIITIIKENLKPKLKYKFDILIFDEMQDFTNEYFCIIKKIIESNQTKAQIVCLGDTRQNIFKFKWATSEYLEKADKILPGRWKSIDLTTSFRVHSLNARLINKCLRKRVIQAVTKSDKNYEYYGEPYKVFLEFNSLLKSYEPKDIMVIAGSVKGKQTPLKTLKACMDQDDYWRMKTFITYGDDEPLTDASLYNDKTIFTTIHQSKGLERKLVIFFGFDISYYEFFAKNNDVNDMVNELYVALTRAKEKLIIVHDKNKEDLPCIFSKISFH